MDTNINPKYVIIGNGAAGYYAAKAIREKDTSCTIILLSKEDTRTYYRPQLSNLLAGPIADKKFYVGTEEWYKDNNIDQLLSVEVTEINPVLKKILLLNGNEISYDKLIIANGSHCSVLPVLAGDTVLNAENYKKFDGIYTIKDVKDAVAVRESLATAKSAVIIGGGLLGLEAAAEVDQKGVKATVVEFFPRLLPRQLDLEGSKLFEEMVRGSNIDILLDDSAEEVVLEGNKVKALKLKSGKVLDCDLLLFSVGIRSNIQLAVNAGIETNRGILVNSKMETNISDIYACGDVAELNGIVYGNWPAAIEMGRVAGLNAVGEEAHFQQFVAPLMFNSLNARIFSAGMVNFDDDSLETLFHEDKDKGVYKKLFFKDNILKAGILIGNIAASTKIISGIKKGISKEEALTLGII